MHFLDKFVYRNPKAADTKRGISIMQPVLSVGSSANVVMPGKLSGKQQPSVNTAAFWNKKADEIAAEDVFFHEYFSQIGKPARAAEAEKKKKKKNEEAGLEDGSDAEAEDEIWQALVDSRPGIQGDEDGDIDISDDDDDDLGPLLDMSDSDDEGLSEEDDDDDESQEGSNGAVEFFDFSAEEDEAEEDESQDEGGAGKQGSQWQERRRKKKELKALPIFASVDDYADLMGQDEEEDY